MNPGERQVAVARSDIRRDHVARYEFAADRLKDKQVLDCACGVGYGSKILAEAGARVKAVDIDQEAIDYAKEHYAHGNVVHVVADASVIGPFNGYDAVVSFETIEHLEDPLPALKRYSKIASLLIASVPNESVFPYSENILYHHRHYTAEQFENLLNRAGYEVLEWHGQAGSESEVEPNIQGRTLIAVAETSSNPIGGTWKAMPKAAPKSVSIVAMGKSAATYIRLASNKGGRQRVSDEVWAINSMGNVIKHDLLFHMDDCRVQESRAKRDPDGNVAGMVEWLKSHPRFITSKKYPEYTGAHEFPLQDVINSVGTTYLNNTVAYAVAYAIFIGVQKISLYGADYSYDDLHKAESGRGCVEFLLGMAAARGIQVEVAQDSTLLDACIPDDLRFYGYDASDIKLEHADTGVVLEITDREVLPTAEEIEIRYNHEPKQ
ncbi:MAG: methyltransferase domain-containing protein [Desulfobacterales bacterium]